MSNRSCATCNLAEFTRTPSGRIKANVSGRCQYEIAQPVLPACVPIGARHIVKYSIWPDMGAECPVYAPKKETP
jgi:hypothetical protein